MLMLFCSVVSDLMVTGRPMAWQHCFHPVLAGCVYLAFRFFKTNFPFSNFCLPSHKDIFSVVYWALGGTDPSGHPWIYPMVSYSFKYVILKIICPIVIKFFFIVHKIQPCIKEHSHSIASQSLFPLLVDWRTFLFSSSYSHLSSSRWTGEFFSSHFLIITFPLLSGLEDFSLLIFFFLLFLLLVDWGFLLFSAS